VDDLTAAELLRLYENDPAPEARHAALESLCALDRAADVGMILIPAGEFLMGSADTDKQAQANEKPQHRLYLPAYFIERAPVTNAQFRRFMETGGYANPAWWPDARAAGHWKEGKFLDPYNNNQPTDQPRYWTDAKWSGDTQPVVGVSWYEALAYARWTGKRLPTEAEWEKAASWEKEQGGVGEKKRVYPWGDTWQPDRCNSRETSLQKTTPVGQYSPAGDSPYGLVDMAGNVWEWCSTRWDNENDKPYSYPYTPDDGREDLSGSDKIVRVLRGGSWYNAADGVRCARRNWDYPRDWNYYWGFRCCATFSLSWGSDS